MASCSSCSTTILFGGIQEGPLRFCNQTCQQNYYLLQLAERLPPDVVRQQVLSVHQGLCPVCGSSGPVDVHKSYRVFSVLVLSHWSTEPKLCCRSCGIRTQAGSLAFSFFLGWWGIPWGLILTPVQCVRNLAAMCKGPNPLEPSAELERFVRTSMALELARTEQQAQPPPLPRVS